MNRDHFLILLCLAVLSAVLWAAADRPVPMPGWEGRIAGFAYSPMQPSQRPARNEFPTEAELAADLALIADYANAIRTYSIDGTLAAIPRLAGEHDIEVTVGVWLGPSSARNRQQVETLIDLVRTNPNVTQVVIGNETQLTQSVPIEELRSLLTFARARLDVPVSTAEPWHIWLAQPALAEHVDFLTVHLLPYWEGFSATEAGNVVEERVDLISETFPDLPIVIGEVGWPSHGRSRDAARASPAAAESFLRRYLTSADENGYDYFLMEAIDQPWKQAIEGRAGAHWGWLDASRQPKYDLAARFSRLPEWPTFAATAVILFISAYWLLRAGAGRMQARGFWLLGLTAAPVANASVVALVDQAARYWTIGSTLAALLLAVGVTGMIAILFVEVREWAEARFATRKRLPGGPRPNGPGFEPFVSIHVPIHAEPPAMVIATLEALSRLDYTNFEVLIVDNNTDDPELWEPVEACCKRLGSRFRFFHVSPLSGYKAGALNYALRRTSPDAEIVAVVDSDYCVTPNWLRNNVHQFTNPRVAIVQAPQDYRDGDQSFFKRLCRTEYSGFFKIGMLTRNDRNAIIQHGTMTLVRASALREVGGWGEWTVTEDAELGLRILAAGYEAIYSPQSYGRGLTPDSFHDYRAQRHRWAMGAVQILRRHARLLVGREQSKLSFGQRAQFIAGWLPWVGDGLNLTFNLLAIVWSALMILAPERFYPPLAILSGFVLGAFLFKHIKTIVLYRRHIGASWADTVCACVAGLSLMYIVGRAVLSGLSRARRPFFRTPKFAQPDSRAGALLAVVPEALLGSALLAAAIGTEVAAPFASLDRTLWTWLLVAFALPHAAAVGVAVAAAGNRGPRHSVALLGTVSRAERF